MKEKPLRVAALRISNILGISEAEIKPGKVTLIEGANGTGKTSLLEAIRSSLLGGHDATLLRKGAESGEIVLVLDDGQEIRKTVTAEKTDVTVTHPDFGQLKKPRSIIEKLCDAFALNPVDFLIAKKETRLQLLLAAIPMKVSKMDLAGVLALCESPVNCDRHALQVIADIEKELYDERRTVNRSLKEKQATVGELKKALPQEPGNGNWKENLNKAKAAQRQFITECDEARQKLDRHFQERVDEARNAAIAERYNQELERDRRLEEIRKEYADKIGAAQDHFLERNNEINQTANEAYADLTKERQQGESGHAQAVAEAEAAAQAFTRAQAARDHVAALEALIPPLEQQSKDLTVGLADLEGIKSDLLDQLPIKGVEVHEGDIVVDGIPFDRLNESRRVRLAVDVAMLRAGSLPILCVDGLESLDSKSIAALEDVAVEKGVQLVLAKVTDGPLSVVNVR